MNDPYFACFFFILDRNETSMELIDILLYLYLSLMQLEFELSAWRRLLNINKSVDFMHKHVRYIKGRN